MHHNLTATAVTATHRNVSVYYGVASHCDMDFYGLQLLSKQAWKVPFLLTGFMNYLIEVPGKVGTPEQEWWSYWEVAISLFSPKNDY